jgi:hypothetical protein
VSLLHLEQVQDKKAKPAQDYCVINDPMAIRHIFPSSINHWLQKQFLHPEIRPAMSSIIDNKTLFLIRTLLSVLNKQEVCEDYRC